MTALYLLVNVAYIVGASSNATVTILDDDYQVQIAALDAVASEPGTDTASFLISHAGCTNAPLTVNYALGGNWGLFGFGSYERLTGDARRSPIVQQFGSPNQWSGGLGVSHTFTIKL